MVFCKAKLILAKQK